MNVYIDDDDLIIATLLETCKTLLTVLLEHDKFREEHFQQCLVFFRDSFLTLTIQG